MQIFVKLKRFTYSVSKTKQQQQQKVSDYFPEVSSSLSIEIKNDVHSFIYCIHQFHDSCQFGFQYHDFAKFHHAIYAQLLTIYSFTYSFSFCNCIVFCLLNY